MFDKNKSVDRWCHYLGERFPPLSFFLTIIGYAFTAGALDKQSFEPVSFILCCLLLFYLAFLFRLDNDDKDFDKDCIAFPDRPLPRGDLRRQEVKKALRYLKYILVAYFVGMFIFSPQVTRLLLFFTGGYLWLIFHNFYIEKWLSRHPLIKGMLHHGLFFPLTLLVISIGQPEIAFSLHAWSYATLLFGAFFTFEICRKLNPYTHPITLHYIHYYGFTVIYGVAVVLLGISAVGAWGFGVPFILWLCEGGVLFFLTILFLNPKFFRTVQIVAGVSLIIHAWAGLWV